jgi:hypothetical protein
MSTMAKEETKDNSFSPSFFLGREGITGKTTSRAVETARLLSPQPTAKWTLAAPISELPQFFLRGDSDKKIGEAGAVVNGHDYPTLEAVFSSFPRHVDEEMILQFKQTHTKFYCCWLGPWPYSRAVAALARAAKARGPQTTNTLEQGKRARQRWRVAFRKVDAVRAFQAKAFL